MAGRLRLPWVLLYEGQQQGLVVVRRAPAGKRLQVLHDAIYNSRWFIGPRPLHLPADPVLTIGLLVRVEPLGHSVRVEQHTVSRFQAYVGHGDLLVGRIAHRKHPLAGHFACFALRGPEEHRQGVAGPGDVQGSALAVVNGVDGRYEAFLVHLAQVGVDEVQDLAGLVVQLRAGTEQGAGHGHHHRCRGAVALGVGHQQAAAAIGQRDDVVVIPAGIAAGLVVLRQLQAGDGGQPLGQELALERGDDLEFMLQLVALLLNLAVQPVDGEVGVDARDDLLGLKGLGNIVHRSQLQALHLVGGLVQGRQENDRDRARGGVRLEPAAHLEAVDPRHHDVQKNQFRLGFSGDGERRFPVLGDQQLAADALFEQLKEHLQVGRVVVHQENGFSRHFIPFATECSRGCHGVQRVVGPDILQHVRSIQQNV